MNILQWLLDSRNYMPHGHCYLWQTGTLWLNVGGDLLIALSYLAIPAVLYFFARRRRAEFPYPWLALLFAAFILLCGFTHFFEIWTVWNPEYRLQGALKVVTGLVSMATAIALIRIMPAAMRLQTPLQLQQEVSTQTLALANTNELLRQQIQSREITQKQLRASDEQFRLATQALRGYIYDVSLADGLVKRSEGFAGILGFAETEIPPRADWWGSRIHPDDRQRVQQGSSTSRKSASFSYTDEYRVKRKDGQFIWIADNVIYVRNATGEVTRAVGYVMDISDRKQAQADLQLSLEREQAARNEAERANRMKDEFLGTLSHELRTPLSAIQSWALLLARRPADAEQVAKGAAVIERNAKLQGQLIADLLDMSRIIAGKIRLDVQPVDFPAIVAAAVETVRPAAEGKNIKLQPIVDPAITEVRGDPARLQQVVWNLLSNAVKFTPKGGRVQVTLARVNSHVELVVEDSGCGIEKDFLPDVFQRFRQADGSTTREHEGLGLGLSIVKQLVELHGGAVRAFSEGLGKGARFTVELPLSAVSESHFFQRVHPRSPSVQEHLLRLDGLRVLVVDDQIDAAESTARLLTSLGANVTTANSATSALQLLQSNSIDVVVTDIGMPQRDGFELIREARTLDSKLPIIALTAFARSEDRSRTLNAGFDAHIAKPADPAELASAIAAVHRRRRNL